MIIKRMGPVSLAKINGTSYAILGLIGGAFVSVAALLGAFSSQAPGNGGAMRVLMGAGAIIFLPIFYGAIGFVASLVIAWLYNVLAKLVGGIQIDVE